MSGFIAACAGLFPALVLHPGFLVDYPAIIGQPVPACWMIGRYATPLFLAVYVSLLFMTIVQTGVGVLLGQNERLDHWRGEPRGRPFPAGFHAALAGLVTAPSLWLSRYGLIDPIARGYGTQARAFLLVFTLPLLTRGVWQIVSARQPGS